MAQVQRDETRVVIPGAENEHWGCSGGPQNSEMATLSVAMRLLGHPECTFEELMGVSGSAFRLHLYVECEHGSCPSSPHSAVGHNCTELANAAIPVELVAVEGMSDDSLARVRAAIDEGTPVIGYKEEDDLVLGYVPPTGHLVVRSYWHGGSGYIERDEPYWGYGIPGAAVQRDRLALFRHSLRVAVEMAETPAYGAYASGWAAFAEWRRRLSEHDWVASLSEAELGSWLHANGFIYWCMVEARMSAVSYLRAHASEYQEPSRAAIGRAADLYDREVKQVLRSPNEHEIAPMSWMRKPGDPWTREVRELQIAKLSEAEALEREAIAELKTALGAI